MLNRRALLLAGLGLTGELIVPYERKRIYSFPSPAPRGAWFVIASTPVVTMAFSTRSANIDLQKCSDIPGDRLVDPSRQPQSLFDSMAVLRKAGWTYVGSNG